MNIQKACVAIILACVTKRTVKRTRWVKNWLQKRERYSHINLLKEIVTTDPSDYKNYFRMSDVTFNKLLLMVKPFIERQDTNMRKFISAEERLAVTLRYLATRRFFEDLKFSAVTSPAVISESVMETCEALIYVLQEYIKFPTCPEEWMKIAAGFERCCNFYNTLGALNGKHIAIRKPAKSVNADKQFIMIDVGLTGKISDGGVLFYSKFGELMEQNQLNLPQSTPLPKTDNQFPYVFVADEAFALDVHLIKPYCQRGLTPDKEIFNKRLSAARVTVENTFGILASRFRVFQKAINVEPSKATIITQAACFLHNFLAKENHQTYLCAQDEIQQDKLVNLENTLARNSTSTVKTVRDNFCKYYNDAVIPETN